MGIFRVILLLLGAMLLNACTPLGVATGVGAAAGNIALEERSLEDSLNDRAIATGINSRYVDRDLALFGNVGVDVVEGRVLLTGVVDSREKRIEAAKIAWSVADVETVINEIKVSESGGFLNASRDKLVETQLLSALTFDRYVKAVNYEITVVDGTVYLFGIAEDKTEEERVIAHARDLAYVRRIVSHMRMKNDPDRLRRLARQ